MFDRKPPETIARIGSEDGEFQYRHARTDDPMTVTVPLHIHSCYEIWYSLTDRVQLRVDGHPYTAHKHDIFVFNCKEIHSVRPMDSEPYERIVCHFRPRFLLDFQSPRYDLLGFLRKSKLGVGNFVSGARGRTREFYRYLLAIEEYIRRPRPESELMIRTLFAQALVCLNKYFAAERRGGEISAEAPSLIESFHYDAKIVDIVTFIHEHLAESLSLDRLEREFGMSKHHLCRLFKRNTGYTVHEYVTNRRIMSAIRHLYDGATALDTAEAVGFNDYSSFYRAFQQVTGSAPNQFARAQRETGVTTR